ncbi:MAG: hypothetical protein HEQ24_00305 [Dolichospermum sp. BR01]|nr:hypothetical protein [Dolichospermum sp. BR01]
MLGYIYLYFILSESDRTPKILLQAIAPPKITLSQQHSILSYFSSVSK